MKKYTIFIGKIKCSNNVTRTLNSSALLFLYSDSQSVIMVKLRTKIFRFNIGQVPIEEKRQLTKSNEKLVADLTTRTIAKTQYNQNNITNPSIMINSGILNPNNIGLDRVGNSDLKKNNKKPMLIENYAQVLINNFKFINYAKNNSKLNYYHPDGL